MKLRLKKKWFWLFPLSALLIIVLLIVICDQLVIRSSRNRTYNNSSNIPYNKVGLVLGTGKYLGNGMINPYYRNRIDAAIELIKSSRVKYLVLSGDNSRVGYDEPGEMKNDLIAAGIDSTLLYNDYAGFRTFDSVIRLKKIFGQLSVTVISQEFHNERAIFIAGKNGIEAIGYNARDISGRAGLRVKLREKLARVKCVFESVFGQKPRFLGDRIAIH